MTENQKFGLKIGILLLKLIKEVTNITTVMIKKRENTCLKDIVSKFLDVIQLTLVLILTNF